jgi:5-methylcytosine-specific restriction enzyme A
MSDKVPTYRPPWMPTKQERDRAYNARRSKESKSFYNLRDWRDRLQPMKLARDPYCEHCLQRGVHEPATHVHHIKSIEEAPELARDFDNMQSLCLSCHSRHHASERGKGKASG